ncbi:MAG TPA: TPM domain-containing protein [Vicinamibacteria bacterium]|nr:TPM domain-containing protein [Vicinamibacteria bacterium]
MLAALGIALAVLQGAPLPALSGRVVDTANLLAASERSQLESRLEAIESETSVQIVIATIPSLEGEPIEDYAVRLFKQWRLGQAGQDNGVLVLVVPPERRVRIEVGYGLEPVIPDGMTGRIIRERIAPAFREERFFDGLNAAVDGLELAARREYPDAPAQPRGSTPGVGIGVLFFIYFVLGVLGNSMGIVLAMIAGAFVFGLLGGSVAAALGWWAYALGALFGLIAVLMVRSSGRRGSWTTGGHSSGYGGGGFGGGGFGGGGFGGGGFSGGGGRSGGGGASGSW